MNPVVVIHLLAALLLMGASVPLIRRKVKMNSWYGVRIPAAFASEEQWFEINHYGGKLLFLWGLALAGTAAMGATLEKEHWIAYNWTALGVVVAGLVFVILRIHRRARAKERV